MVLECAECGCPSDDAAAGWVALRGQDPDEDDAVMIAFFCPRCSEREFGLVSRRATRRSRRGQSSSSHDDP